ncbi:MAG: hypothetical protein MJY77_07565, partial [Bacteroidaceae bacterium]|nr:hypothetical protein [Bacteroidaceae bacterium]
FQPERLYKRLIGTFQNRFSKQILKVWRFLCKDICSPTSFRVSPKTAGNHQPMHRTVCERGGGSVKNQADTLELRIYTVYRINFRERKPNRNHICINCDVIPVGFVFCGTSVQR